MTSSFDMHSLTYIIAAPEEIIQVLVDEKLRDKWDMRVKTVTKEGESCLKIHYIAEESTVETVKYNLIQEGTTIFIQECVNGDMCRYFELSPVQNRPYFLRLSLY